MELTATNLSIDILTSFIFLMAIWRGSLAFYYNHLNLREKIHIFLFIGISALYVFQAVFQVVSGGMRAPVGLWDVLNLAQAFLAISYLTYQLKKSE